MLDPHSRMSDISRSNMWSTQLHPLTAAAKRRSAAESVSTAQGAVAGGGGEDQCRSAADKMGSANMDSELQAISLAHAREPAKAWIPDMVL